jgi:hypothetical protein
MTGFKSSFVAATALSSAFLAVQSADGATVRHIDCFAQAGVTLPLINTPVLGSVRITNNWSFTIPAGTVYSYSYAGKNKAYQSPTALAPKAALTINDNDVTATRDCDATFPDARFDRFSPKALDNMPNVRLQRAP